MPVTRLRMDELVNAWVGDQATPFQLGLLAEFDAGPLRGPDGTADLARVRAELARRAARVPALGRRVVWTRPGEGLPFWAPDPDYDPTDHLSVGTVPPGADLATLAANRSVRPLPMDRPLWSAQVLGGMPGGGFAVVLVLHHVLADGLGAVRLAGALLDGGPEGADAVAAAAPLAPPPLPSHRELRRLRRQELLAAGRPLPGLGARLARRRRGLREFRQVMSEFDGGVPLPESLPRRVGPGRRMVIVREPLDGLRRAGHALGGTLNDLLLTAVTGGLRALLLARGEDVEGRVLQVTVPAVTAGTGQVMGMLLVGLPVGEPDALRCLAHVHRETSAGKARLRAMSGDVSELFRLPTCLAAPLVHWGRRFGSSRIALSVADVPGPADPLWLAGARARSAVPVAPLAPGVGLSVAALSYAGGFAVSITADAAVADLPVVAAATARTFAELRAAADGTAAGAGTDGGTVSAGPPPAR